MNIGVFYTSLSAVLYGCIGYFGASLMKAGFSVCDLLLWRFLVSWLMLFPFIFMVLKDRNSFNFKGLVSVFTISAIFYGGGTACYFEASKTIGTGLAMIIFFTYPIFVALLSIISKKAPVNIPTLISLFLIVTGSILIAFGNGIFVKIDLIGFAFALASGLGYGLYVFGTKEASKKISPLLSAFVVCAGNTTAFILYSFFGQKHFLFPTDVWVWIDITSFALIGTVLPIFLLLQGMKSLSANKVSIIGVLEPVSVLAVGAFILKEEVTWLQFLGAGIILSSAIVVQFEREGAGEKTLAPDCISNP